MAREKISFESLRVRGVVVVEEQDVADGGGRRV